VSTLRRNSRRGAARTTDLAGNAYLVAALFLGGASAAGQLANTTLQLCGIALILWCIQRMPPEQWWPHHRLSRVVLSAAILLALIQFLPLPSIVWQHLPGRERVAEGFQLIGTEPPWLVLSLTPAKSLQALASTIPGIAIFLAMRGAGIHHVRRAFLLVVLVACGSCALGLVQFVSGNGYVYAITNYGRGPGLFANSNHQSLLMLIALTAVAGLYATARRCGPWTMVGAGMTGAFLVLGVAINGSLACLLLLPIALVLLAAVLAPHWRRTILCILVPLFLIAAVVAAATLGGGEVTGRSAEPGINRHDFAVTGWRMLDDVWPVGAGLGSFATLYPFFENPDRVGATFVNHAHNEPLEWLVETGLPGLMTASLFLWWLGRHLIAAWSYPGRDGAILQASSVATVLILLHSLVDYPIRTAAILSLFSMFCAVLMRRLNGMPPVHRDSD
jgi:O-antigen ligase